MPLKALREAGASLNTGNRRAWKGIIRILHEDNELWFRVPKGREMSNPSDKRRAVCPPITPGRAGERERRFSCLEHAKENQFSFDQEPLQAVA